jgi:hypothetical protein
VYHVLAFRQPQKKYLSLHVDDAQTQISGWQKRAFGPQLSLGVAHFFKYPSQFHLVEALLFGDELDPPECPLEILPEHV